MRARSWCSTFLCICSAEVSSASTMSETLPMSTTRSSPAPPSGQSASTEVCEDTVACFHEDVAALGPLPPDHEPRATEDIRSMIDMIQTLIDGGFAYAAEGHVLFSVAKMPAYGALSGRSMEDMIAGARVEVAPYKRDPADFVLWKPSSEDQPGWTILFRHAGTARLAYRVLGHGAPLSWRDVRHSCRGSGSGVSAP